MIILRTVHGSHLYGLVGPTSDHDWYEVHDHVRTRQVVAGGDDTLRISLSHWLRLCDMGTHQALEAMFAPDDATTVDVFRAFRHAYRANVPNARATYRRTIAAFNTLEPTPKRRRHAVRLAHDAESLTASGRFDPTAFSRTSLADMALYL
ncbi:hypothetical protein SCMU_13650 [Sinomonas cyclohexanicum]|uniref:Core-binding (CB) domain-containing protein n=1 Tax=Sinomonas cyclohexanicum TaxID=322009 RepID=A0ABM7PTF0_SINCY|nr:hypothetical protein [Corynebacterium cyclohexanicum]BCT75523.1 hypothetical protein SCMU_13650 [Corynebacterium cyclohexanicum]